MTIESFLEELNKYCEDNFIDTVFELKQCAFLKKFNFKKVTSDITDAYVSIVLTRNIYSVQIENKEYFLLAQLCYTEKTYKYDECLVIQFYEVEPVLVTAYKKK